MPVENGWSRLERAAGRAVDALAQWRARAGRAEAEVVRQRSVLEEIAAEAGDETSDRGTEVKRLRAENAALSGRLEEAHARVSALLTRITPGDRNG